MVIKAMLPLAQQCQFLTEGNEALLKKVSGLETQTKALNTGLIGLEKALENTLKETSDFSVKQLNLAI